MAPDGQPDIQLIANLVVRRADGQILFVRLDPEDDRWWLPGDDLEPYEHPDERARKELTRFGVEPDSMKMVFVESFRGRRGWHVMFNYLVETTSEAHGGPKDDWEGTGAPMGWFAPDGLPPTMHGSWEHNSVHRVLADSGF